MGASLIWFNQQLITQLIIALIRGVGFSIGVGNGLFS